MRENSLTEQQSIPLLRELDSKFVDSFGNNLETKKNELNLTIFYRNKFSDRETFTCKVKPRHFVGPDGQEMLIVFEHQGTTKSISLPLKTMVGDLLAYVIHSVTKCNLQPDKLWSSTNQLRTIHKGTEKSVRSSKDSIEVIDSQCSVGKMFFKSKKTKIIAIRNLQSHLCALVSNEAIGASLDREIITLLDQITEELNNLLKSKTSIEELEKVMNSAIHIPNSSADRWNELVKSFEKTEVWKSLKLIVDHALFLEMLHEMNRIVNGLFSNRRVDLSENDKVKLMETAIFFDKMREMRA
jgi:argonaute-like protein implicated in RNA metabolism and viral defense